MLTAVTLVVFACLLWPGGPSRVGERVDRPPSASLSRWADRVPQLRDLLRGRGATDSEEWVADFAEVVSVGLDAGLDLASAAVTSARSPGVASRAPWLAERLDGVVHGGLGVVVALEPHDALTHLQRADLAVVTTAWRLADEVGAAASAVTFSAARSIRDRQAARQRLTVVVAGPRASMWLLTALPLVGPLAGALVGMGPDRLYGSPASRAVALLGLLLTGLGWWWCRVLLRRALRPARTDGDPE